MLLARGRRRRSIGSGERRCAACSSAATPGCRPATCSGATTTATTGSSTTSRALIRTRGRRGRLAARSRTRSATLDAVDLARGLRRRDRPARRDRRGRGDAARRAAASTATTCRRAGRALEPFAGRRSCRVVDEMPLTTWYRPLPAPAAPRAASQDRHHLHVGQEDLDLPQSFFVGSGVRTTPVSTKNTLVLVLALAACGSTSSPRYAASSASSAAASSAPAPPGPCPAASIRLRSLSATASARHDRGGRQRVRVPPNHRWWRGGSVERAVDPRRAPGTRRARPQVQGKVSWPSAATRSSVSGARHTTVTPTTCPITRRPGSSPSRERPGLRSTTEPKRIAAQTTSDSRLPRAPDGRGPDLAACPWVPSACWRTAFPLQRPRLARTRTRSRAETQDGATAIPHRATSTTTTTCRRACERGDRRGHGGRMGVRRVPDHVERDAIGALPDQRRPRRVPRPHQPRAPSTAQPSPPIAQRPTLESPYTLGCFHGVNVLGTPPDVPPTGFEPALPP